MTNEKRLIDANNLKNEMLEENPYIHFGPYGYCACSPKTDGELVFKRDDVLRAIDSAPAVDAVEVVRCKDCAHCDISYPTGKPTPWYLCKRNRWTVTKADDFCSYGERKDNG